MTKLADDGNNTAAMKSIVFHGQNKLALEDRRKTAAIESMDAAARNTETTICGTDLHNQKGDVPAITDGCIPGHEGVGIIEEAGKKERE